MMRKSLVAILQFFSKLILEKYKPQIIAITGSVGKTSSKEAIFAVLKNYFDIRKSPSNYNNELGVPLAIIGAKTGGRSIWRWFGVFLKALRTSFFPVHYPRILILEMGADHPGDIDKLVKLSPPGIGVVTAVGPAHLEFFGTVKRVAEEKVKVIESLSPQGTAVLNADDEIVYAMRDKTKADILTYGFGENIGVRAVEVNNHLEEDFFADKEIGGINFKIASSGSVVPIFLSNMLGKQHVYAALSGAAVGLALGLNLIEVSQGLKEYQAPRGRMRLVAGIKNTLIIDDSYNSSPKASLEALDVLQRIPVRESSRKIAVLGDMLELGAYTEEGHREIGRKCAESTDVLVAVGEKAKFFSEEAKKAGMAKENILFFHSTKEAGHFLQNMIKSGDVLLIKGSQGMRMERVVKELMAEPLTAGELLARQEQEWK